LREIYYLGNAVAAELRADGLLPYDTQIIPIPHAEFQALLADTPNILEAWNTFYTLYPEALGYLRVSRPAIDGDVALVHIDFHCHAVCGTGVYVLMRRTGTGAWAIYGEASDWVS
jgi:hypothetical protein